MIQNKVLPMQCRMTESVVSCDKCAIKMWLTAALGAEPESWTPEAIAMLPSRRDRHRARKYINNCGEQRVYNSELHRKHVAAQAARRAA